MSNLSDFRIDEVLPISDSITTQDANTAASLVAVKTLNDNKIDSDISETGTTKILNIVQCTQAAYDLLTPVSTTFYVIVG